MLLVTGLVALALVFWARWLGRRNGAPAFIRRLPWIFSAAWAAGAAGTAYGLRKSFGAISDESVDPSQKARVLGEGISEAMNLLALSAIVIFVAALVMLVLTWRYHWTAKPPVPGSTPPYR